MRESTENKYIYIFFYELGEEDGVILAEGQEEEKEYFIFHCNLLVCF